MNEFSAIAMNDNAVEKCRAIREEFSEALTAVKQHVKPGRELALVTTKMQEACMWAIRGVAMDPANAMNDNAVEKCRAIREAFSEALTAVNQHTSQPGSEATEASLARAPIGGQRHG